MNAITIVLRSGMGMQIDSVRPYLRNGIPIAIGRAGAVISHFADGDAHLALRTIAEYPCPKQDSLPAANMRQIALAALGGAGASSEPGNPGREPVSGQGIAGAQAEAERPEGTADLLAIVREAVADAYADRKMTSEAVTEIMTGHWRIVGALRADRDSWAEQAEQRLADWDEMRKERDAALAEVEALRAELQSQRERNTELIFKLGSATNGWGRCEKERDAVLAERDALATEAQALREEVTRGNRIIRAMALDLAAVGEVLGIPAEQQEGGAGEFIEAIQALQEELGRAAGQGGPSDA
ncbi:hypothetical protein ACLD9I_004023 [Pseudomonas aeruginosa]